MILTVTARRFYPPALQQFSRMPSPINECALSILARTLLSAAEMMRGGWGEGSVSKEAAVSAGGADSGFRHNPNVRRPSVTPGAGEVETGGSPALASWLILQNGGLQVQ